ncbi:MAG: murein biosynthesis integral membrane protein MurJ [Candidatus Desantisbacteria bacterium]
MEKLTKNVSLVSLGILTSRIFGYIRDVFIGHYFSSEARGVFFAAWVIPNSFRRIFGEGALSASFIPIFSKYLCQDRKEAFRFSSITLNLLLIVTSIFVIIGIALSPIICGIVAPGFTKLGLTGLMSKTLRIILPYLSLVCVFALIMAVLNSLSKFFIPTFAPTMVNLSFIGCIIFLCPHLSEPIIGLAVAVLIGGILQIAVQIPSLISSGVRYYPEVSLSHPGVKQMAKRMLPSIVGISVFSINSAVDTIFGSLVGPYAVSALYYANRLVQLPLSLFGTSVGMVSFPTISRHLAENRMDLAKETLSWSLRQVIVVILPAAVGLMILGKPIVCLLFEHGKFSHTDVISSYYVLFFYALGLVFYSGVNSVVSFFYALGDTKTPVMTAIIAMLTNICLNWVFLKPLEEGGIALATSIASFVNISLLLLILRKRIGGIGLSEVKITFLKSCVASLIMAIFLLMVIWFSKNLFFQVGGGIVIALAVYIVIGKIIGIAEINGILKFKKGHLDKESG